MMMMMMKMMMRMMMHNDEDYDDDCGDDDKVDIIIWNSTAHRTKQINHRCYSASRTLIVIECTEESSWRNSKAAVYPKKYVHGFVELCFVVVMQSFIMNSHEVFIHIHQGCFAGTGAIVRLPQCQWSKPDGYGKISQCITTTKHSKAKTVCIFLGIYCKLGFVQTMNILDMKSIWS